MKLTTVSCLLVALHSVSFVLAEAIEEPAASSTLEYTTAVTPSTELVGEESPNQE